MARGGSRRAAAKKRWGRYARPAVDRALEAGVPPWKIVLRVGCTRQYVYLRRAALGVHGRGPPGQRRPGPNAILGAAVDRALRAGVPSRAIAEHAGCSRQYIYLRHAVMRRSGDSMGRLKGRPIPAVLPGTFRAIYVELKKAARDAARRREERRDAREAAAGRRQDRRITTRPRTPRSTPGSPPRRGGSSTGASSRRSRKRGGRRSPPSR